MMAEVYSLKMNYNNTEKIPNIYSVFHNHFVVINRDLNPGSPVH